MLFKKLFLSGFRGLFILGLFFLILPANRSLASDGDTSLNVIRGKGVYERYCVGCHGVKGDGRGIYAEGLNPKPRDFTSGVFKWTGGQAGSIPSDLDLMITVSEGVHGTSMPAWRSMRESDRRYVVDYIKTFSLRFKKETPPRETFIYPPPPRTPDEIDKGKTVFEKTGCMACHGPKGRADGRSAATLMDDWGDAILPANFSKGVFKTGKEEWKIYRSIANGLGGTPMPSFSDQLKPVEIWELVYYIQSLRD